MFDLSSANKLLVGDIYKHGQYLQYPQGTEYVSTYIESRGGEFAATVFFGLQAYLREYLIEPFTSADIDEAEELIGDYGSQFDRQIWQDLLDDHGGYFPLEIEAIPEGTVLPTKNALVQVVNTDPKYFWLPLFLETSLIRAVWYPTTVATVSWWIKKFLGDILERTSDNPGSLRNCVADFGCRGVSSHESALLGGMAHIVNFNQTETAPSAVAARKYYGAVRPAGTATIHMEHASISSWGMGHEVDQWRALLDRKFPVVGLLVDTYDYEYAIKTVIGKELKEQIESYPGLVGIRVDSGDPIAVTSNAVEWLMDSFGYEVNSKGFKVLPRYLRVLQGDGLNLVSFRGVFHELARRGLSAENALAGMGGGLLQKYNRDTLNFGHKANAVCIEGVWKNICKRPIGDKMKHSKAGRLAVCRVDNDFKTVQRESVGADDNLLVPVFRNGQILRSWDWNEVVERSENDVPRYYYESAVSG